MTKGGSEFTGSASEMRASDWLAVEDLIDKGDVHVVIESCREHHNVAFEGGRKEARVFSLAFTSKAGKPLDKQLVLNATNRKYLVRRFGSKVSKWAGVEIVLYLIDGVRNPSDGTTGKGIRLRTPDDNVRAKK